MSHSDDLPGLLRALKYEATALEAILPAALDAQWAVSPIPKPRYDTSERAQDERHSDPTADTVLDGRRSALRAQVVVSEDLVRAALVSVIGVRRGLELRLARWEGEEPSPS